MAGTDIALYFIKHLNAIHYRHHDIADDHIGHQLLGFLQAFSTIPGYFHLIPLTKLSLKEGTQIIIVFYQQQQWRIGVNRGCIHQRFAQGLL